MSTIEIGTRQAATHLGKTVRIKGHVHTLRDMGNLVFLVVRDAQGTIQVVADDATLVEEVRAANAEEPVIIEGELVSSPKGASEIRLKSLQVLAKAADTLPVEIGKQKKMDALALSTMLDYRPLTLRSEKARAIFKIEAAICRAFRQFLSGERFMEIHSPKIVATGTEGGANLFKIEYFGREAYLAQSPQFYKQMMVGVFERVFEIGPVYRAEEHDTTRHLNEYISMDYEMGFIESEQDIISMQVKLIRHIFDYIREECKEDLALYGATVPHVGTIPQLKFHEALDLLATKLRPKSKQGDGLDIDPEGERLLCQYFLEKEGIDLVYVTHYPIEVRPFYAMPEGKLSRSFDLLFRGLEVTTGGQRIHQYEKLIEAMKGRGLDPEKFTDYLMCFKYGMPPHGGLAIGLERLAKQLLGLPTVKLASLFPRDLNRLTP